MDHWWWCRQTGIMFIILIPRPHDCFIRFRLDPVIILSSGVEKVLIVLFCAEEWSKILQTLILTYLVKNIMLYFNKIIILQILLTLSHRLVTLKVSKIRASWKPVNLPGPGRGILVIIFLQSTLCLGAYLLLLQLLHLKPVPFSIYCTVQTVYIYINLNKSNHFLCGWYLSFDVVFNHRWRKLRLYVLDIVCLELQFSCCPF